MGITLGNINMKHFYSQLQFILQLQQETSQTDSDHRISFVIQKGCPCLPVKLTSSSEKKIINKKLSFRVSSRKAQKGMCLSSYFGLRGGEGKAQRRQEGVIQRSPYSSPYTLTLWVILEERTHCGITLRKMVLVIEKVREL